VTGSFIIANLLSFHRAMLYAVVCLSVRLSVRNV